MQHYRNGRGITDSNSGYFGPLPVEMGVTYTASAYVMIPDQFHGNCVELSFDVAVQAKNMADMSIRGRWQRVSTSFHAASPHMKSVNLIFRIYSQSDEEVYSSCWQIEEGMEMSAYLATSRRDG
jgi:hypothetical protein